MDVLQSVWMSVPILFVVLVTAVVKWLAVVAAVVVGIELIDRKPVIDGRCKSQNQRCAQQGRRCGSWAGSQGPCDV